jgi:hypothetical protein
VVDGAAEPTVRASFAQLVVARAKRVPEPGRGRVLDAIGAARAVVRSAFPLGWVPAATFMDLADAIDRELAPDVAATFWRTFMTDALVQPMMKPFVAVTGPLLGTRDPRTLIKRAPQVHGFVTRGCATLLLARVEPGFAELRLRGMVPALRRSESFVRCYAGTCEAVLVFAERDPAGAVRIDTSRLFAGEASMHVAWPA